MELVEGRGAADLGHHRRRTKQGVMNACATKAKNTREVDAACYIVEAVDCKQAANCGLQAIASDVLNRCKSL
ncbi:hypothetical protein HaLaN_29895 [Haematococcus lacustris]|uniref:Uncharacterized protein n=1 Tax=Haematococcus lacustris TaxID=44745 RepID=A0A6A0AE40_HAELA|nr:hypothetical protein HaLaN_29895 [Haematococcus lacustris]